MAQYFSYFIDNTEQPQTLVAAFVLLFGLSVLGSAITGRNHNPEASVFAGWGVVSFVLTLGAVFLHSPLGALSWALLAAAVAATVVLVRSNRSLLVPGLIKALILATPLLLIASAMEPSQWDEFSHWLPAPKFLFQTGDVPSADNPVIHFEMLSGYPYGWPFLTYLASNIAGGFTEGVSRVINIVFLLLFGLLAVRVAVTASGRIMPEQPGWRLAGLAVLAATLLNPTFIQKIILTAYADVSTAVALGFATYILWKTLDALADNDAREAHRMAWQAALVLTALINIKQVNLVLFAGLIISYMIVALRDPGIRLTDALRSMLIIVVPPLILYGLWRYHLTVNMSGVGGGEATFRPFENWHIALIPKILLQMLVVAGKKTAFFAIMAAATGFAVAAVLRLRTSFDRLAIMAGGLFVSYNAFLFFTYVASFGERQALTAVSYWRYNSHLGMVALLFAAASIGILWRRFNIQERIPATAAWLPLFIVLILPLVFAKKLRFDLEPDKPHFTRVARDIAGILPEDKHLIVMDPQGTGESAVITRYRVARKNVRFLSAFMKPTRKIVNDMLINGNDSTWVIVHSVLPVITEVFGPGLQNRMSYLLRFENATWRVVRQWPYPEAD